MKPVRPGFAATLVTWCGLVLVAFLSVWLQNPPAPVPATAAATEFSAERALQHVRAIARAPRPIGSANHAAARDYIFQQLRAFGLEAEIQKTTAINPNPTPLFLSGTVENVLARKRGGGDGHAVLLVAHYDSVPTGPGANDDAVGVATLLETARALTANAQLQNDIVFLFTDAEETGLLGARAFMTEHRWAKKVEVALNFEGRGNGGPVIMFETSPQNGGLVGALAKASGYPLANSLSDEIYKRLPNTTDLTVFKTAVPGMNFAYIHGLTHYHTALDNVENVSARTVQHHGSYALALSRHFGAAVLPVKAQGDAIYFDALGFVLVRYPAWLAWPVTVGVLLVFGVVVRIGFWRKELAGRGIALGALLVLLSLIAAAGAAGGLWWLVLQIHPEYSLITQGDSYSHGLYVIGFAALSLATASAVLGSFGRRIREQDLFVGALLWWAALMVALTIWVTGGSYLATWPLLFALPGIGYGLIKPAEYSRPAVKLGLTGLGAIPGVLLIVPFVHLVFIAMPFALAPALVLPLSLLSALFIPLLRRSTDGIPWLFPGMIAALALLLFVLAGRGGFDKDHRQSNHLLYTLDATTQRALWVSSDSRPDEWTAQFFGKNPQRGPLGDSFPLGRQAYLHAPAPVAPFTPPEAQVLEDVSSNGLRHLRLRLSSPRGAERISVQIRAEILSTAVEGKPLPSVDATRGSQKIWSLVYLAPPKEGIELFLETRAPPPMALRLVDESYGLPLGDGITFTDRPAHMMPAPFFRSDFTLISKNYSF